MVDEAERKRGTYGIATFKVKVGRRPIDLDIAVGQAWRGWNGTPQRCPNCLSVPLELLG